MTGAEIISAERARQLSVEGFTPEHDAEHARGELIEAAVAYLTDDPARWPWRQSEWNPSAGALIAAEIDRRQALPPERVQR